MRCPRSSRLKLVAGLELRGRGDIQLYRVELPGPKVTKDIAPDAKVRLEIPRARFNDLATKGHIPTGGRRSPTGTPR